jgi:hypothetical protein
LFRIGLNPQGLTWAVSNSDENQKWCLFWPGSGKTTAASFLGPARTVRSNPRVPPPYRTLAVGYRDVRQRKTRGGGAGGDEAAARGRGLAPRGHGVEARIITGELLHPGTPPPVSPR